MSFALPIPLLVAAVSTADSGGRRDEFFDSRGIGLLPATTLVIWVCCLIVGVIGMFWPGSPSNAPTTQPQANPIEAVEVEVTDQPPAPADMAPPSPPMLLPSRVIAPLPAVLSGGLLTPLSFLPRPAPAPQRVVNPAPVAVAVKNITFGVGEGRQPTPQYPEEARYAGEEGSVTVLFNVGDDGRVISATAVEPCPWPILNQAAVSAIRQTWRFAPGPPRAYRVAIQYQLNRR